MNKRRKFLLGALAAAAVSATCLVFTACGNKGIVNNFDLMYDGQTITVSGEKGANVEFPEVTREGYIFKGWYTNSDFIGMPVTSAVYGEEVTYYANWAKGYAVTFELDGGTLDLTSTLYLEEGASVANAVQSYIPAYGEYQFGGWYLGDEPLAANVRMTTAGITLTARYKAQYSVDVYLQSLENEDVYVKNTAYTTGYALIDEDFTPEVSVNGYSLTSNEHEVTDLIISKTTSQNVFSLYYDRNNYTLTLSANYPDGTFETINSRHLYEQKFTLPENTFKAEGCRFLGWATSQNASYADIIKDSEYSLSGDEVLYAIWNVGLVDLFSGEDRIFVDPADSTKITLCRGGVDIEGTYDEISDVYTLTSSVNPQFKISVKLRNDGKFVYLSNRYGSYSLYTSSGSINEDVTMIFDEADGCTYNSKNNFTTRGTYVVDEDGLYTATVVDRVSGEEQTVYFKLGLAYDSNGRIVRVFRIRGEEYSYGGIPRNYGGRLVYPVMTFDGFGGVGILTPDNRTTNCTYLRSGEFVNVYTTYLGQTVLMYNLRFDEINGQRVYELYDRSLDSEYTHADNQNISLKLNGSSTAVYTDGENDGNSFTGTYIEVATYNGAHIVAVYDENNTVHMMFINGVVFTEESNVSGVYMMYDGSSAPRPPVMVVKAAEEGSEVAEAVVYGMQGNFWEVISRGEVAINGMVCTYTANGEIADWTEERYSEMRFVLGSVSTSSGSTLSVYFPVSAKEKVEDGEDTEVSFATEYVAEDGSKLTLTKNVGIYEPHEGDPVLGNYTKSGSNVSITTRNKNYYFIITEASSEEETNVFEVLASAPLTVYQIVPGAESMGPLRGVTLTLTGREIDGKLEAVYSVTSDEWKGTVEVVRVNVFDQDVSYNKFVGVNAEGREEVFYFTMSAHATYGYIFVYYHNDSDIVLGSLTNIGEDGKVNSNIVIRITADNKMAYRVGNSNKATGTWSVEERTVFGVTTFRVYTFTPDNPDGEIKEFKFVLRAGSSSSTVYFLIAGEDATYTAADGSVLELNGETRFARYTDKNGVQYENYYWVETNVLDEANAAYSMYAENDRLYFDVNGETFTLRGAEAASYYVFKNNSYDIERLTMVFDGYGHVKATVAGETEEDDVEYTGAYVNDNGKYTVTLEGGKTFIGRLGVYVITVQNQNVPIPAFYIEIEGYEGSYLNEEDLTVLTLDAIGNAVKYSSYGVRETGTYAVLADGLIYYINSRATTAAVYSVNGDKIVNNSVSLTYYADDMTAAVFRDSGNLSIGGELMLYTYDAAENKFTVYGRAANGDADANDYGFIATQYDITDGGFNYGGKDFNYFDGSEVTLTATDGSTVTFLPTGAETFSSRAVYTYTDEKGEEKTESCFVIVWKNTDGELQITLSRNNKVLRINGSVDEFVFTEEHLMNVNLTAKTFGFIEGSITLGLMAVDYDYDFGNSSAESSIFIWAEEGENGEMQFSVSGYFTVGNQRLTFNDGKLSKAGGDPSILKNFSNIFVCEFTGSDKNLYHLYFTLGFNTKSGNYVFLPCPLVRVSAMQNLDEEGTVYYAETFCYAASAFNFEGYTSTTAYNPTIKYKGELINTSRWAYDRDKEEWRFFVNEYSESEESREDFLYTVKLMFNEDDTFASAEVNKYSLTVYTTGNYKVSVWSNENGVFEIYAIAQSSTSLVKECVNNGDGSFNIVTVDDLYYKITFNGDEVTVERLETPTTPGVGGGEAENPEQNEQAA